jgi:hypothetical protein
VNKLSFFHLENGVRGWALHRHFELLEFALHCSE